MEIPRWVSKKIVEESEELGGIDIDDTEDLQDDLSCNKGGHKERSLHNQPNHLIFWKKHDNKAQTDVQENNES